MKTDDFEHIKVIGRGAFGKVQLVRHKHTRKVSVHYKQKLSKLQFGYLHSGVCYETIK